MENGPGDGAGNVAAFTACAGMVKHGDRDRALCAFFAPPKTRPGLFAIAALNLELARLPDKVSEPLLGEIRLQWWRETIATIYGGETPPRDDISRALAATIARFDLSRDVIEGLIDARAFDLIPDPPEDLAATMAYIDNTAGAVTALWLQVLDGENNLPEGAPAEAARHVARAYGLSGLLRALPAHARRGRLFLPASLMKRHQVRREDVFSHSPEGNSAAGLAEIAVEFADQALGELAAARALTPSLSRDMMPVMLPAIIAESALKTLKKSGYDVFAAFTRPHRAPLLKMALRRFTGSL